MTHWFRRNSTAHAVVLAAIALSLACDGGGGDGADVRGVVIAPRPGTLRIARSASGTASVAVARAGGFDGAVSLSSSGAPAGMTVTFDPALVPSGANTSTVTVNASAAVPVGSYPISLRADGDGIERAEATLVVDVEGSSGTLVTLRFCPEQAPIWLAQQDGDGAWTRVSPGPVGAYDLSFATSRAGLAIVEPVGSSTAVTTTFALLSVSELQALAASAAAVTGLCGPTKSVSGSVAGVGPTQRAIVWAGYASQFVDPNQSVAWSMPDFPAGNRVLLAARVGAGTSEADALIIRREVNPPNGGSLPLLDFAGAEAFGLASSIVNVSGIGVGQTVDLFTCYRGVRDESSACFGQVAGISAPSQTYRAIPAGRLNADERQVLGLMSNDFLAAREAGVFFRTPGQLSLSVPPALAEPNVILDASTPYLRPRFVMPFQSAYGRLLQVEYQQQAPTSLDVSRTFVLVTTAYLGLGGAQNWEVTLPDVSAAAGWSNAWAPRSGLPLGWCLLVSGGAFPGLDATVAEGSLYQRASRCSSGQLPTIRAESKGGVLGALPGSLSPSRSPAAAP